MTQLIFLGGTCGNNNWRDELIDHLVGQGVPATELFNPVVPEWNEDAQRREDEAKRNATCTLFYLGDPMQDDNHVSYYSLLEATMGLYDQPYKTAVVFDTRGMPDHAAKATRKACADLKARFDRAPIFDSLVEAEDWIASQSHAAAA